MVSDVKGLFTVMFVLATNVGYVVFVTFWLYSNVHHQPIRGLSGSASQTQQSNAFAIVAKNVTLKIYSNQILRTLMTNYLHSESVIFYHNLLNVFLGGRGRGRAKVNIGA